VSTRQTVRLADLGKYERRLAGRLRPMLARAALSAAMRSVQLMQQRTTTAPPASPQGSVGAFNYGQYRRVWRATKHPEGAVLFNPSKYAGVIEFGRRAGRFPPLEAIARWAQRKFSISRKDALQIAYPIAHAIARRGLLGRRVMTGAVREMADIYQQEFRHELDAELARP
jgi:hypothetical protein